MNNPEKRRLARQQHRQNVRKRKAHQAARVEELTRQNALLQQRLVNAGIDQNVLPLNQGRPLDGATAPAVMHGNVVSLIERRSVVVNNTAHDV